MEAQQHSGLGVASFVVSIIAGFSIFVLIVIAGLMETSTPGGLDENSIEAVLVGLLLIAFVGLALVALVLGIVGLVQKQRKKIFALLGTVFSGVSILCTIVLIAIGLSVG